ncbi:Asparagine-rich zinc finger protein AZF1 [Wickerhamiella sorbophila]|uniref:Asparagine-rich zinc finger protein AZF1 n=1 Tax=Wickerhamiella sorbophila TaxID=45607 RepID=A0A2T0FHM9_9ASCO|nr:Asparagine-rich zinc finger protein AZF1 [Wickerhamiella sorbophila]PRT54503.1 Asparagine-rich zinc finger protein AZF1 [Wickerhamiella sorbophila]
MSYWPLRDRQENFGAPVEDQYSTQWPITQVTLAGMPGFNGGDMLRPHGGQLFGSFRNGSDLASMADSSVTPVDASAAASAASTPSPTAKIGTVDHMMLYVQAMQRSATGVQPAELTQDSDEAGDGHKVPQGSDSKHRYQCNFVGCNKSFRQRMHLETHKRSHTGERPFVCPYPGCSKAFSQRSNLRTHTRSHSGERPFSCEVCGRRFTQRGNLKNHQKLHGETRQFACKLDGCTKTFNQLGNLKAHHNSAHAKTVAEFTMHLQEASSMPKLSNEEQEMFTYFCNLYRNANRGIKGRGKGTRTIVQRDSSMPPNPRKALASLPSGSPPRSQATPPQSLPPPFIIPPPQGLTFIPPPPTKEKLPLPPLNSSTSSKQTLPTLLPASKNPPILPAFGRSGELTPSRPPVAGVLNTTPAEQVAAECLMDAVQNWKYFSVNQSDAKPKEDENWQWNARAF